MANKFCTKCGRNLPDNAQFCDQCGAVVVGTEADIQQKEEQKKMEGAIRDSQMNLLTFLFLIYAIPVLILSIVALCNIDQTMNILAGSKEWADFIKQYPQYTIQMVRDAYTACLICWIGSGALALVSGVCVVKRKWWLVATVCSFIATILCLGNIFGIIIGFFVSWMTLSAKDGFVNDPPKEPAEPAQ